MRVHGLVLAVLGLAGCGWFPEVESGYLIDRTRILAIRVEVVELGPVWPARVGFDPDDAPITEAMPGDRVQLSGLIVGADGRALPSAEFDALWVTCGSDGCGFDDRPRCQDIEWPLDAGCEIGRGGEVEFEVPPATPGMIAGGVITTFAIFALEPGLDVDECVALLRDPGPLLGKCTLLWGEIQIGPRWGLLAELAQAGAEVDFPLTEIPYPAFQQPANRLAMPGPMIWFDVDTDAPIVGEPLRVHAGQAIYMEGTVWRAADLQLYVLASTVVEDEAYVFLGYEELRTIEWYFSEGLTRVDREGPGFELHVDEDAPPGPVSLVMLYGDERVGPGDTRSAFDFRVIEFEVVP